MLEPAYLYGRGSVKHYQRFGALALCGAKDLYTDETLRPYGTKVASRMRSKPLCRRCLNVQSMVERSEGES